MRILHLSGEPLPDIRVEKMAYLSKENGFEVFFAGRGFSSFALGENTFDGLFLVPWFPRAILGIPPYYRWIKRRIKKIVMKVKPDIIHAHNVVSAKVAYDLRLPFVFDDHEILSLEKKSDAKWSQRKMFDRAIDVYQAYRCRVWERKIAESHPVIVTCERAAEYYARFNSDVFAVPNYPSYFEIKKAQMAEEKNKEFTAVYLGGDVYRTRRPFRNVSKMLSIFKKTSNMRLIVVGDRKLKSCGNVISTGFIPHLKIYQVASRCHIGLLPWEKHWVHYYVNPNKPYIYAHCGLVVVVTSSLQNVVKAFRGNCITIESCRDLETVIKGLFENLTETIRRGLSTKKYAEKNFVFEHYAKRVKDAYKRV